MNPPVDRSTSQGQRVRAIRGAVTLDADDREEVLGRTSDLLHEVFVRNGLAEEDLVSIIFTATEDLKSAFPAEAARQAGFNHVPLLCARELAIDSGIPRCIRVLVHAYTDRPPAQLRHVYLREARQLRTDLPE